MHSLCIIISCCFIFLDIPLKERQEVELLEQVLKKALKIRSSSAVSSNYPEKPPSCGNTTKAPVGKDSDKRNPQKSALLSSELKGSRQRAGQLKSTAGNGDVATRQGLVKTGRSSQPTIKVKQSGRKPFPTQKSTGTDVTSCSLQSDKGMKSTGLSSSEGRTFPSDQELKPQSEASAPKEHW